MRSTDGAGHPRLASGGGLRNLGAGPATYHAGDDTGHLHLVCESCGRVTEADVDLASGLVGSLRAAYGFQPDVEHMAISGRCADCADRLS